MVYEIIPKYNWGVFHPLYNLTNQGPFFHCSPDRNARQKQLSYRRVFGQKKVDESWIVEFFVPLLGGFDLFRHFVDKSWLRLAIALDQLQHNESW